MKANVFHIIFCLLIYNLFQMVDFHLFQLALIKQEFKTFLRGIYLA